MAHAISKPTKSAATRRTRGSSTHASSATTSISTSVLLDIKPENDDLILATVLARPSVRNKSPYVGDIELEDGRHAVAHMPSMDMGGKCHAGARILLKPARDAKGVLVGRDAVGKYGTPKCEFIAQLLWVHEPENRPGCWVGAHPSLGEKLAHALLAGGHLNHEFPAITKLEREVSKPCDCDMRADFVLTHADDGSHKTIVEVKTVVDTDAAAANHRDVVPSSVKQDAGEISPKMKKTKKANPGKGRKLFLSHAEPYVRTAIFPWGGGNQTGPEGEKVHRRIERFMHACEKKPVDAADLFSLTNLACL